MSGLFAKGGNVNADDDDDWDDRSPVQYLFDRLLLPGLVLLLTSIVFFLASLTLYGTLSVWSLIFAMIE